MNRAMPAAQIVNFLADYAFREPFASMPMEDLPEELRVVRLISDFEAECAINGFGGWIENSTGRFFSETVEAFRLIGAHEDVAMLEHALEIMGSFGLSPCWFHDDDRPLLLDEYDAEQESARVEAMFHAVDAYVRENPYPHGTGDAPIFDLLEVYAEGRREHILAWTAQHALV